MAWHRRRAGPTRTGSGFTHGGWQAPLLDEDSGDAMFEQASHMDALLLGRKTYEFFASYWPHAPAEIPFTALLNDVPKYVASRTLGGPLDWKGSTLIAGDLTMAITGLKDLHEEIHVIGSLDLVQTLLRSGLVDRLSLWVYPLLLGTGKQVFGGGTVPTALRLTESVQYPSGTVHVTYDNAGEPTYGDMATGEEELQRLSKR